ncbi:BRICHOS domain-containing protein 5 isoform X1 [Seriola aureovittata]|uniref:BRICHOS domain-containing protein 5 isoform X1 n=1 Tax=Seriola aureovittata TaxID=2871759 RepID=UPI0024BEA802|nr:BRICHOS domain-containing protein 5 isoform X1 [Seriola aureovittata]
MVRCWKHSENRLEEAQCTDGGSAASPQSHFPHKAFWVSLSASLLLVVITLGLTGYLGMSQPHSQSLQIVRIAAPDQTGALINQSAVVDQQNDLVTFSVTSPANQTSTVLFDIKHGLICYKPVEQDSCLLRKMEPSDYDNVHSLLHESTHKARANRGWSTSASTSASPATSACLSVSTTCQSDCVYSILLLPAKDQGSKVIFIALLLQEKKTALTVSFVPYSRQLTSEAASPSSLFPSFRERRDGDRLSRLSPKPHRHSLHV